MIPVGDPNLLYIEKYRDRKTYCCFNLAGQSRLDPYFDIGEWLQFSLSSFWKEASLYPQNSPQISWVMSETRHCILEFDLIDFGFYFIFEVESANDFVFVSEELWCTARFEASLWIDLFAPQLDAFEEIDFVLFTYERSDRQIAGNLFLQMCHWFAFTSGSSSSGLW